MAAFVDRGDDVSRGPPPLPISHSKLLTRHTVNGVAWIRPSTVPRSGDFIVQDMLPWHLIAFFEAILKNI